MTRAKQAIGTVLTISALAFVIVALLRTGGLDSELWRSRRTWAVLSGIGLLYGATLGLVLACWVLLLQSVSKKPLAISHLLRTYAVFQILKYVPTNVMHHIGRYAMLRGLGVEGSAVIWSTFAEATLLSLSAAIIAASFGLTLFWAGLPNLSGSLICVLFGVGVAVSAGVAIAFRKSASVRHALGVVSSRKSLRAMALALPLYGLFFITTGFEFWLMAELLPGDISRPAVGPSIGAIAAAWLSGFVTPGSPGGIGIRETMIVIAFGGAGYSVADAALLAALYRIVTIIGDVTFAGGSYILSHLVRSGVRETDIEACSETNCRCTIAHADTDSAPR